MYTIIQYWEPHTLVLLSYLATKFRKKGALELVFTNQTDCNIWCKGIQALTSTQTGGPLNLEVSYSMESSTTNNSGPNMLMNSNQHLNMLGSARGTEKRVNFPDRNNLNQGKSSQLSGHNSTGNLTDPD